MLHQRELVGVGSHLIEQPVDQIGGDIAAEDPRRSNDRLLALFARQARGQILAFVQSLRQSLEDRAVAKKIRAHRNDDVYRDLPLPRRRQEKRHERVGFVAAALALEPEDLLELIDQNQEIGLRRQRRFTQRLDDAQGTAPQCRLDKTRRDLLIGLLRSDPGCPDQGLGEAVHRMTFRPQDRDLLARPGVDHEAGTERSDHPGADKRGLAAARGSDDGEKAGGVESVQKLIDLLLAPEEEVRLFDLERPEAGIRREEHHQAAPLSRVCKNRLIAPSSTPPRAVDGLHSGELDQQPVLGIRRPHD